MRENKAVSEAIICVIPNSNNFISDLSEESGMTVGFWDSLIVLSLFSTVLSGQGCGLAIYFSRNGLLNSGSHARVVN